MKRILSLFIINIFYFSPGNQDGKSPGEFVQMSPRTLQVPVLCYHNVLSSAKGHQPAYTISARVLEQHLQMLSDSGFHTILPNDLYEFFKSGKPLPSRPVMLTFDDAHEEHASIVAPLLLKFHFNAVFFVMTVVINKPRYLSSIQLKSLADSGHIIGCHTFDHPDIRKLNDKQWNNEVVNPKMSLEKIIKKPVEYFGYPYGAWNKTAIQQLKRNKFKAAFQLAGPVDESEPLYTIRRMLVAGTWSTEALYREIQAWKGDIFPCPISAGLKQISPVVAGLS